MAGTSTELAQQPNLGHFPIAHHRIGRNFHYLSRFLHIKAAEESQFDNFTLPLIYLGQPIQGIIESHQIGIGFISYKQRLVKVHVRSRSSTLLVTARASEVNENAPHQLRAHGEEVGPVLPLDSPDIHQSKIGFMNERGGLESMSGALTSHVTARGCMYFAV